MKAPKILIIYLLFVFPIVLTCLILIASGTVSPFYHGFAVDSSGILYIGKDAKIEKYLDGKMIGSISPQTSRGYAFTIKDDDTILLSTASNVYTLDLLGNVVDEKEDMGTSAYNELQNKKRTFITRYNKKYFMRSQLGRTMIISDQDIIYQMPVLDYIVKIAIFALALTQLVVVPIIIRKWRKG